LLLIMV